MNRQLNYPKEFQYRIGDKIKYRVSGKVRTGVINSWGADNTGAETYIVNIDKKLGFVDWIYANEIITISGGGK